MNGKIVKIVALVILVFWVGLGVLNASQIKHLQKPFLAFPNIVDKDGKTLYLGLGFSFLLSGDPVEKADMYLFGIRIVSAGK